MHKVLTFTSQMFSHFLIWKKKAEKQTKKLIFSWCRNTFQRAENTATSQSEAILSSFCCGRDFQSVFTVSLWMTASTGALGLIAVIQAQVAQALLSRARCIVLVFLSFFLFSLLRHSCLPADMSHQGCRQECTPARLPDVHCSVKKSRTRGANVQRSPRPWFSKHAEQMRDKPIIKKENVHECLNVQDPSFPSSR